MKLPIGISDFGEVRAEEYYFIDKSLLIQDIMDNGAKVILFPRPRRFGKTLNMSMLKYFFEREHAAANKKLFDGLAITQASEICAKHQGQHPVIFLSFKDIKPLAFSDAYAEISALFRNLYHEHSFLLDSDKLDSFEKAILQAFLSNKVDAAEIKLALMHLASFLYKHTSTKPIILIDEYDTPIHASYTNDYYNEMINLMRGILGAALKDGDKWFGKAIITGIAQVAKESIFSGLNNFESYSVLDSSYGQYFGFTKIEVKQLMHDINVPAKLNDIKSWYNGYQIGSHTLYNPWSILNCLKRQGELKPYWMNSSSNDVIRELLSKSKNNIKAQFEQLLQGNTVEQPINENLVFTDLAVNEQAVWSLFVFSGYLKVTSQRMTDYQNMATLAIPNHEIMFLFTQIVANWFSGTLDLSKYSDFIQALTSGDYDRFVAFIQEYILQSGSYFDFAQDKHNPERVFHVFVLGLVVGLRQDYIIESNREYGFGRYDVAFIPKDKNRRGIMLEFKAAKAPDNLEQEAQDAMQQIQQNRYSELFKQHGIKNVDKLAMAFHKKQVKHLCA